MVNEPDFFAQLQALTEEYAQRLDQELKALKSEVDVCAPFEEKVLARLHKLAGAALTFGFSEVGEAMRELEHLFQDRTLEWEPVRARIQGLRRDSQPQPVSMPKIPEESRTAEQSADENKDGLLHARRHRIGFVIPDRQQLTGLLAQFDAYNYEAVVCHQVQELIERQQSQPVHAVILVMSLQHEHDRELKELQNGCPGVPVLVCSPHQDFAHKLAALRAGAVAFFDLATTVSSLDFRLRRLLDEDKSLNNARVLILDDDLATLRHYQLTMSNAGLQVLTLDHPDFLLQAMQEFKPDVIVLDLNMPECRGDEVAAVLRLDDTWMHLPIIYLSSENNPLRQLEAQTLAGDEFLIKPVAPEILVGTIRNRARRARQLAQMLSQDGLTGLLTHAEIKDRLDQELSRLVRHGRHFCLAMLDLDHFKKVNDEFGHLVGDSVLRHLAGLLKGRLRRSDLVGRYGGEEFLLILPDCDLDQANCVVDQLRENFAHLPLSTAIEGFFCTFSAGISSSSQIQDGMGDSLIALADEALYQAKSMGRNQVVCAS